MTGPSPTPIDSTLSDALLEARPVWGAFIGGGFVESTGSDTFEVLEAANGRTLARVVDALNESDRQAQRKAFGNIE